MVEIATQIANASSGAIAKYHPTKIILTGGGAMTDGTTEFIENAFSIPTENIGGDASVRALSAFIWNAEATHRGAYLARRDRWARRWTHIKKYFTAPKSIVYSLFQLCPAPCVLTCASNQHIQCFARVAYQ